MVHVVMVPYFKFYHSLGRFRRRENDDIFFSFSENRL